jgi:hypothetical protein
MKNVPNENILKLRELTDRICMASSNENDYKLIVDELKQVIKDGKIEIERSLTDEKKVNCYETMCMAVMNIINKVK